MKSEVSANLRRRYFFRIFAVLLGLLPFILLECALRWLLPPPAVLYDDPLVDLHQLRPLFVRKDPSFASQQEGSGGENQPTTGPFLAIPESRYNYFRPQSFPVKKPERERRIFVLGGSTVQGRPFSTETAFATWLQLALQGAAPDYQWKCINCGGISYASYRVSVILQEVLNYEPDLIILYTGHNEYLEDRSYGDWVPINRSVSRALTPFTQLATVRWLAANFRSPISVGAPERTARWVASTEVQARLDQYGGLDAYSRDTVWRTQVIDHFRSSLRKMMRLCKQRKVPMLVCVPVSDIADTPPFKIASDPLLTDAEDRQIEVAWQRASSSKNSPQERFEAASEISLIDPYHAGAAYVGGRMLIDMRRYNEAKEWLKRARDWDVCPLRAPTEIVDSVRQEAIATGTPYIDVVALCEQESPNEIVGRKMLIDHVHPTIETHQKIALWLLHEIADQQFVILRNGWEERSKERFARHLSTLDEAYFARGFQRLEGLKKWASGRAGEMSVPQP